VACSVHHAFISTAAAANGITKPSVIVRYSTCRSRRPVGARKWKSSDHRAEGYIEYAAAAFSPARAALVAAPAVLRLTRVFITDSVAVTS
jgi:hypothetical protein